MEDRKKFRVYFKGSEYAEAGYEDLTRNDVIYSLRPDGQIIRSVAYECQEQGREGSPCNLPFTPKNDLYDIQFSTGLKDKNDKLVYFDDLVKNKWGEICKVVMQTDERNYGRVVLQNVKYLDDEYNKDTCFIPATIKDSEIIGNIYENPELLEEKC